MEIEYHWLEGKCDGFDAVQEVRRHVFVEEQGYSLEGEFDEVDAISLHIVGLSGGEPLATARLYKEDDSQVYHVGRVAVLPKARGHKIGLRMLHLLAEKARELGGESLVLNAQTDKTYFYECAGYSKTGNTMLDEGQPHVEMIYKLK